MQVRCGFGGSANRGQAARCALRFALRSRDAPSVRADPTRGGVRDEPVRIAHLVQRVGYLKACAESRHHRVAAGLVAVVQVGKLRAHRVAPIERTVPQLSQRPSPPPMSCHSTGDAQQQAMRKALRPLVGFMHSSAISPHPQGHARCFHFGSLTVPTSGRNRSCLVPFVRWSFVPVRCRGVPYGVPYVHRARLPLFSSRYCSRKSCT